MKLEKTKSINIALFVLSVIAVICIIIISFLSMSIMSENTHPEIEISNSEEPTLQNQKEKIIYNDDNFKVTYIDFIDPNLGTTAFNLLLKIQNNSDKQVVATLGDGYANDTAVFFGSGIPIKIAPGKNAVGTFILTYGNTDIKNIDEIKTLEFKIQLFDENFSKKILETENIVINLE